MDCETARRLALAGEMLLVDIRDPDEWRETGLADVARPISVHVPGFLAALDAALGGDKTRSVGLICAAGGRSAQIAAQLAVRGYVNVVDVSEGMNGSVAGPGWLRRGLPVTPWDAAG